MGQIVEYRNSRGSFLSIVSKYRVGASWEGFALEQVIQTVRPAESFFWATHSGAEIDLFFLHKGRRYGIDAKFNEAPKMTRSMKIAVDDLGLDHLWIIYPGQKTFPVHEKITVWSLRDVEELPSHIG